MGLRACLGYRHTLQHRSKGPITAPTMDTIGRALCRAGESLHVIDVRGGRVTLTPAASWNVLGSDDPESWLYRVTLNGPTTSRTLTVPAAVRPSSSICPAPFAPLGRPLTCPARH